MLRRYTVRTWSHFYSRVTEAPSKPQPLFLWLFFRLAVFFSQRAEAKFFRGILPQYYEHHCNNPGSVLTRFCGMYLVKSGHKKIPFIVMKW